MSHSSLLETTKRGLLRRLCLDLASGALSAESAAGKPRTI